MVPHAGPRSRTRLRLIPTEETSPARSATGSRPRGRYDDLTDRRLAAILAAEDTAQEHGLSPHARTACYVHRCWVHQCVSDPVHVIVATGHRWCRRCERRVDVDVDESGSVELYCEGCGEPDSAANREVLSACRTSLAAMRGGDAPTLYSVPGP